MPPGKVFSIPVGWRGPFRGKVGNRKENGVLKFGRRRTIFETLF